jgi:hypothetical protein
LIRPGAGDELGDACGEGVGVWASAFSGVFVAATTAAPAAGKALTKLRRAINVRFGFFMVILAAYNITGVRTTCGLGWLIPKRLRH